MEGLIIEKGRCLNRETESFEAESAKKGVPDSLWESYSAFANTDGGTIVLGLDERSDGDGFDITGVKNADHMVDEIWSTLNNPEKISVNILLRRNIYIQEIDGKKLIVMEVPPARRTQRPVYVKNVDRGTFKRNGSGDYHCTRLEIGAMYRDSSPESLDGFTADSATIGDLDRRSIDSFRMMLKDNPVFNEWRGASEDEFLRLIGAARMEDGELKPTVAGLVMFGDFLSISQDVPGFFLDYREYQTMGDEWTLRQVSGSPEWTGNLLDFYLFVIRRIPLMVGTGFDVPDGLTRVDDTPKIRMLREAVTNAVSHADYRGRGGIVVDLHPDRLTVRNPGRFRIPVDMAEIGGTSDPRNENVFRMLRMIGKAEQAGTGVRNMFVTCRDLGLDPPVIEENDKPESVTVTIRFTPSGPREPTVSDRICDLIRGDDAITMDSMAEALGVPKSRIVSEINLMKASGRLRRVGGSRGRWILGRSRSGVRRDLSVGPLQFEDDLFGHVDLATVVEYLVVLGVGNHPSSPGTTDPGLQNDLPS